METPKLETYNVHDTERAAEAVAKWAVTLAETRHAERREFNRAKELLAACSLVLTGDLAAQVNAFLEA